MKRGQVRFGPTAALLACALAGCAQTSRVDDAVSSTTLVKSRKAVAVMRVGAASPSCINVAVLLGVREGEGYRGLQRVQVANVRSLTEPAVAEVELDPGEYHVLAYSCAGAGLVKTLSDRADPGTYRTSYASFTLAPGEIVNVGYLHVSASRVGTSAFGRPLRVGISVTDWPLAELDRYKQKRAGVYAQMTTRLMTVRPEAPTAPAPPDCGRLRALHAEGKVQRLPAACQPPETARKAAG